ncbi:polyisoprenoid-binding protein YceI [Roseivirga ehrenbergii]|uniref:Lipid-binding protein n=1 Tax=Roseivirga ehrenbergii (strain DSM 102268 / JCM 13514 / KCTC 12282 / NCIMB 14502 / KMM 6017) TaxID=279360 RepID=A0A150X6Z4_ROSEK|nr:YceI family protein [Roseivirga ehrenbergii]KYG74460.1 lipid-binding protein [Roseivirga ehrenbergii]TCL14234.1 polyisoprenoid-binding protein YceI [Roseivirga ehrenbergii]
MKTLKSTLSILAAVLLVAACGPKEKTVETSDAKAVASAENATTLAINTENSMITWIGSKPAGKHNGTIPISEGEVKVEGTEIVAANFQMDITNLVVLDLPADSEYNGKLKGHLMSADFFDAENHPTATFEMTGAEKFDASKVTSDLDEPKTDNTPASMGDIMVENPTHIISGNLTMRGTTKNISFPATVTMENGMVKAKANFNIDRTEWGLTFKERASLAEKLKDDFIYNTVNVGFEIETAPKPAL